MKISKVLKPNECRNIQDNIIMQDILDIPRSIYDKKEDVFKAGRLSFPTEAEAQEFLNELEEEAENETMEL